MPLWRYETASAAAPQAEALAVVERSLARLDEQLKDREWLSGDGSRFGMADVAAAPGLFRMEGLRRLTEQDLAACFPRVRAWSDRVLARPTLQRSVPDTWTEDHRAGMVAAGSLLLR